MQRSLLACDRNYLHLVTAKIYKIYIYFCIYNIHKIYIYIQNIQKYIFFAIILRTAMQCHFYNNNNNSKIAKSKYVKKIFTLQMLVWEGYGDCQARSWCPLEVLPYTQYMTVTHNNNKITKKWDFNLQYGKKKEKKATTPMQELKKKNTFLSFSLFALTIRHKLKMKIKILFHIFILFF